MTSAYDEALAGGKHAGFLRNYASNRQIAEHPETGERVTRKVTRVWVHDDQVLDLVVDGEVITTTEDHLFWSVTDQQFERADQLGVGEVVLGDAGREITVSGFRLGTTRTALAYNLSIAGVHLPRRHRRGPRPQRLQPRSTRPVL